MKTWKIIVLAIAAIVVIAMLIGVIFSVKYAILNHNRLLTAKKDLSALVGNNAANIARNKGVIEEKSNLISGNTGLINNNTDAISHLADVVEDNTSHIRQNRNELLLNTADIANLAKTQREIERIVWAHGVKTNRIVSMIFEIAYGDNAETKQKIYNYTKDPYKNKGLWDEAMLRLRQKELEKILEITEIQEKTIETQIKIQKLKRGCFKK